MSDILWCCHVRGPDEVHAAPDYDTALKWADIINEINWWPLKDGKPRPVESYADCLVQAVPAIWPYSAEAHAEDLPKSVAGFASPAVKDAE